MMEGRGVNGRGLEGGREGREKEESIVEGWKKGGKGRGAGGERRGGIDGRGLEGRREGRVERGRKREKGREERGVNGRGLEGERVVERDKARRKGKESMVEGGKEGQGKKEREGEGKKRNSVLENLPRVLPRVSNLT